MDVRPIDANTLVAWLENVMCEFPDPTFKRGVEFVHKAVSDEKRFPTLDYEPVRHGEWIEDELEYPEEVIFRYKCSECGRSELVKEPYCHCGARMGD